MFTLKAPQTSAGATALRSAHGRLSKIMGQRWPFFLRAACPTGRAPFEARRRGESESQKFARGAGGGGRAAGGGVGPGCPHSDLPAAVSATRPQTDTFHPLRWGWGRARPWGARLARGGSGAQSAQAGAGGALAPAPLPPPTSHAGLLLRPFARRCACDRGFENLRREEKGLHQCVPRPGL